MSLEGTWNSQIASPMGAIEPAFTFTAASDGLDGVGTMNGETLPLVHVEQTGDAASWRMRVSNPIPMTIKFEVVIDGNTLAGTAKPGLMPAAKFTATRV